MLKGLRSRPDHRDTLCTTATETKNSSNWDCYDIGTDSGEKLRDITVGQKHSREKLRDTIGQKHSHEKLRDTIGQKHSREKLRDTIGQKHSHEKLRDTVGQKHYQG